MRFRTRSPRVSALAVYLARQTMGRRIGRVLADPLPLDLAIAVMGLAMEYQRGGMFWVQE